MAMNDRVYESAEDYITACLKDRGRSFTPEGVSDFNRALDRVLDRLHVPIVALTPAVVAGMWYIFCEGVLHALDLEGKIQ